MLLALLLPDPCDSLCPKDFKAKARELLSELIGTIGKDDESLRKALLTFIGDFANWDNSAHPMYLKIGRGLVKAAHPEETPLVVDPFAGGGSIPLEALRLGCETFASDLNPVACLILKVMLEDIPRHGPELAEELRRVGGEIKNRAEKELAEFYPKDPDGATPIAYIWARTVNCESPKCGAEIPLMRSFWLCKKTNRKVALRPLRLGRKISFEIFHPKSDKEVPEGTVSRARARCLCCGTVLPPERVRAQLSEQRGGADVIFDKKGRLIGGARLMAVVTLQPGIQGRNYRLPTDRDYQAVWKAQKHLKIILDEWERNGKNGLCPVPDEPLPPIGTLGFRIQRYGMLQWGTLFTARQKIGLVTLARCMKDTSNSNHMSMNRELLSVAVSRCSSFWSSLNMWVSSGEFVANVFGRQALPIVWDFCEVFPVSTESGGFDGAVDWVARVTEAWPPSKIVGQVQIADATEHPLSDDTVDVYFTDPPYYDAIPYSDLSDFFLVWLKRTLSGHSLLRDPFDPKNALSPKIREAIQDETKEFNKRPKDKAFFEKRMGKAFAESRRLLKEDGINSIVFAHKTTEGWEALLSGMIRANWTITGSWPIATERPGRLRSQDSAALATSVHLVCRPRPDDAPVGDWGEVLRELPKRVGNWMERLQGENIRGADLVFACIGPALEIFSRYSRVETAEGKEVKLAEYLEKIWEVVGRTALENILGTAEAKARNGMAGALEEDARLTALFLWTLQSTNGDAEKIETEAVTDTDPPTEDDEQDSQESSKGKKKTGYSLIYDVVRRFAQPLGIHLEEWEDRIIVTEKGVVRLLPALERATLLFGEKGAQFAAKQLEIKQTDINQVLLPGFERKAIAPEIRGRRRGGPNIKEDEVSHRRGATTLDRVHAAMILQSGGQTNALRALLKAEVERGPDFLRLANALSALYPKNSEEKRLLDAMLLAIPR